MIPFRLSLPEWRGLKKLLPDSIINDYRIFSVATIS